MPAHLIGQSAVVPCPATGPHLAPAPEGGLRVCGVCRGYGSVVVALSDLTRVSLPAAEDALRAPDAALS